MKKIKIDKDQEYNWMHGYFFLFQTKLRMKEFNLFYPECYTLLINNKSYGEFLYGFKVYKDQILVYKSVWSKIYLKRELIIKYSKILFKKT